MIFLYAFLFPLFYNHNNKIECRPRGILTRRLCRNRKYEDNELYRSNSFRFQKFERSNDDAMARGINKQVSGEIWSWTFPFLLPKMNIWWIIKVRNVGQMNNLYRMGKVLLMCVLLLICNNLLLWVCGWSHHHYHHIA